MKFITYDQAWKLTWSKNFKNLPIEHKDSDLTEVLIEHNFVGKHGS